MGIRIEQPPRGFEAAIPKIGSEEAVPGDGILVRVAVEHVMCQLDKTAAGVGGDHGVPGDGVFIGHFIEQAASGCEVAVENVPVDHGVPGDSIAAGHGSEKAEGEGEAAIGDVARDHGIPGDCGAAGHPVEEVGSGIAAAVAHMVGDDLVPSQNLGVGGCRILSPLVLLRVIVPDIIIISVRRGESRVAGKGGLGDGGVEESADVSGAGAHC